MRRRLALALALGAACLGGCGGSGSSESVSAAVRAYYSALSHRDAAAACARLTPTFWQASVNQFNADLAGRGVRLPTRSCAHTLGLILRLGSTSRVAALGRGTVINVVVRGASATGTIQSRGRSEPARFIRAGGHWLIDCCTGAQLQGLPRVEYRVPSGAMLPTLRIGEIVSADNAAMRAHPPAFGDIITFHPPQQVDAVGSAGCSDPSQGPGHAQPCDGVGSAASAQLFIKRVVGLPGDRIALRNGYVVRNGVLLHEPYAATCGGAGSACTFRSSIVVPPGCYYVLGDNRGVSFDSRFWGPVRRAWIVGVVRLTARPPQ